MSESFFSLLCSDEAFGSSPPRQRILRPEIRVVILVHPRSTKVRLLGSFATANSAMFMWIKYLGRERVRSGKGRERGEKSNETTQTPPLITRDSHNVNVSHRSRE